jgi:hypothetical protein
MHCLVQLKLIIVFPFPSLTFSRAGGKDEWKGRIGLVLRREVAFRHFFEEGGLVENPSLISTKSSNQRVNLFPSVKMTDE